MFTGARNPEPALAVAVLVLALILSKEKFWRRACRLGWWEPALARVARRKRLAILIAAAIPLVLRVALLPLFPIPEPRCHDEFSFLLAADTFAHGRLVNPPHPFWMHFESIHILVRPTYASAFPIAQAAALAAGKVLLGHPWAGVWLSGGFAWGAICWMLQGWLPPRWALLGAMLAILRLGVSSYWMNTYWGGFMAAAGGALVLGALPRIIRTSSGMPRALSGTPPTLRWPQAIIMGAGFAILANSRPFEGAIFGLVAATPLLAWIWRSGGAQRAEALRQFVLPLTLALAVTGVGMGYYFWRVTGKPWVAPYALYRETMTMAPHFLFQHPTPEPLYDNREMRSFYTRWEMDSYNSARMALRRDLRTKLQGYWRFYLGPLLTIPLLALPSLWRKRHTRQLLLMAPCFFALALAGQVWHNPHYAAPATGLAILIVMLSMRRLRLWRWQRHPVGLHLVRCLPVACAFGLVVQIAVGPVLPGFADERSWRWPPRGGVARARILKTLEDSGTKHLIFVRYRSTHDPGNEWVYNSADIDGSPVVWARELNAESNAKLMHYFAGRQVWLVEPDLTSPHLEPYRDAPVQLMRFVQVGAPGIDVLRSEQELREKVLEKAKPREVDLLNCRVWNDFFTEATGVLGPPTSGCGEGGDLSQKVSFEHWFSWLKQQR
ncbi:MAG: hypothetical protein WBL61_21595 [Bryobacteraceae bacterium]